MTTKRNQDTLVINKLLFFEKFTSPKLGWHYNKSTNKWDIVYKLIKPSKQNGQFWVVCDCNQKHFTVNKRDLHSKPPKNKLSVQQVIQLTMNKLVELFTQTNVCVIYDYLCVYCYFCFNKC